MWSGWMCVTITWRMGSCSAGADRLAKGAAIGQAAAGVDHRDRLAPDHEAYIADGVPVGGCRNLVHANAHEQAGRHLRDLGRGRGERRKPARGGGKKTAHGKARGLPAAEYPHAFPLFCFFSKGSEHLVFRQRKTLV